MYSPGSARSTPPHVGAPERVERCAAQPPPRGEHAQHRHEPASEPRACAASRARAARGGWRWKVSLRPDRQAREPVDVEARDLVLVLVGDQLVEAACDGLGQLAAPGEPLGLDRAHARDRVGVAGARPRARPSRSGRRRGPRAPCGASRPVARRDRRSGRAARRRAAASPPPRRSARHRTTAGSATQARPQANAARLRSTPTPLSRNASSIAPSDTGIAPRCQAAPSTTTFAGRRVAEDPLRDHLRVEVDVLAGARRPPRWRRCAAARSGPLRVDVDDHLRRSARRARRRPRPSAPGRRRAASPASAAPSRSKPSSTSSEPAGGVTPSSTGARGEVQVGDDRARPSARARSGRGRARRARRAAPPSPAPG